jgi:hypothetical protein
MLVYTIELMVSSRECKTFCNHINYALSIYLPITRVAVQSELGGHWSSPVHYSSKLTSSVCQSTWPPTRFLDGFCP